MLNNKVVLMVLGGFLFGFCWLNFLGGFVTDSCKASELGDKEEPVGMANPSAIYCVEMGYEYKIIDDPSGQKGVCIFPDGSQCGAWDFLKGKCGENYSYCIRNGYNLEIRSDGKNPFSREYAVCVSQKGDLIGSVTELTAISERSEKKSVSPLPSESRKGVSETSLGLQVPSTFDWRNHNGYDWMTSVKNQGGCGSCWAFGSAGTVEAMYNIRYGDPYLDLDLSEEYLVSNCHTYAGAQNCCGGWKDQALGFIRTYGIPDESCMPYVDTYSCSCSSADTCNNNCTYKTGANCSDATCSDRCADWENRLVKIDSFGQVLNNREIIKEYLLGKGPLAVSVGIGGSFGGYWDGDIYRCSDDGGTNHVVIIVGYDEDNDYWIIKNSWGSGWNGDGYYKLGYNECRVEVFVYYADKLDCGCTIAGNIVLDKDYLNCSSGGLTIMADGITLDCNGHIISGDSTGYGISVYGNNNVTIKDCIVQGFEEGIHINSSSGDTVAYNTVNYNNSQGIHLDSCNNSVIRHNNINNNNDAGIFLLDSHDDTLKSNDSKKNIDGILLDSCSGIILTDNTTDSNLNTGISLHNSLDNSLIINFTRYNDKGILITHGSDNFLLGNEANHNNSGIQLEYSSGDSLDVNTANNNSGQGIILGKGSTNNILINNYTYNNGQGIMLDSTSDNILTANTADSNLQGIYLKNTYGGDSLTENNANNNNRGIVLDSSSSYNYIASNNIQENTEYGVYLDNSSQFNIFWGNELTGNGGDDYETGSATDNSWNLDYVGNKWSDCDSNPGFPYYYQIAGPGDGIDYYPDCVLKLGDSNGDEERSVSDIIYCINYLFKGGPAPEPLEIADSNCSDDVNVSDVVYMVNFLFKGGPPPGC